MSAYHDHSTHNPAKADGPEALDGAQAALDHAGQALVYAGQAMAYADIAARITRQNLIISYITIGISILAIVVTLAL